MAAAAVPWGARATCVAHVGLTCVVGPVDAAPCAGGDTVDVQLNPTGNDGCDAVDVTVLGSEDRDADDTVDVSLLVRERCDERDGVDVAVGGSEETDQRDGAGANVLPQTGCGASIDAAGQRTCLLVVSRYLP